MAELKVVELKKNGVSWARWLRTILDNNSKLETDLSKNDLAFLKNRFKEGKKARAITL